MHPEETTEFWLAKSVLELVNTAATLHRQRREAIERSGAIEVEHFRRAFALSFIKGVGIEVGAGDRPWPLPDGVQCFYGDVRDKDRLSQYFQTPDVEFDGHLDAQTLSSIKDASIDFVLSGHVIEHLANPIGAIKATMRVLKPGGIFLLALPDMRFTHDRRRPETTIVHLLNDEVDGGIGTRRLAYEEHVRYVHSYYHQPFPEDKIASEAEKIDEADMDIHWHAWTDQAFRVLLEHISERIGFVVSLHVSVQNECIFLLTKSGPALGCF